MGSKANHYRFNSQWCVGFGQWWYSNPSLQQKSHVTRVEIIPLYKWRFLREKGAFQEQWSIQRVDRSDSRDTKDSKLCLLGYNSIDFVEHLAQSRNFHLTDQSEHNSYLRRHSSHWWKYHCEWLTFGVYCQFVVECHCHIEGIGGSLKWSWCVLLSMLGFQGNQWHQ